MTRKAKAYLFLIYLVGLPVSFYAFTKIGNDSWLTILLWVIIAIPFEIKPIQVVKNLNCTLSFVINIAIAIIYGYWVAIVVASLVTAIIDLIQKKGIVKLLFNVSQSTITLYLTGVIFFSLKKTDMLLGLPQDLPAFIIAYGINILTNILLVIIIVALTQRKSVLFLLKKDIRMTSLYFAAMAPMSMLMVILYKEQPLTMALIIPTLALAHTSFRNYISLRIETTKTLEVLADCVDRRDSYTAEHSQRVASYADAIAEEMGLDDEVKELIELAGKVHDLGKISISNDILLKEGPLTESEMKIMRTHPDVAYNILRNLEMYKDGAVIVRTHHARFDGQGYPLSLKESEIHIGARIMAVADAFDAMTSDRPYRRALNRQEAIIELRKNSGSQFDPAVVNAFIKVLAKDN